METHFIELRLRRTPGDPRFHERWREIGPLLELPVYAAKATILVVDQFIEVTDSFLEPFSNLKFVVSPTTGHTHLKADFSSRGIELITLRGETEFLSRIKSVSEFVFRQILTFCRHDDGIGRTLNGAILGIVGLGRIGKQVAFLGSSFGMKVISVDKPSHAWEWRRLFSQSDFISLHLDENESTKGIVTANLLSMMKPTAFLINTARASVLDQSALIQLIDDRKIAGAALDVWDGALTPIGLRLVLSLHVAGNTLEDRMRTDEFIIEKLKQRLGKRRVRESSR